MAQPQVKALIERIHDIDDQIRQYPELEKPFIYRSRVLRSVEQDGSFVEAQLGVTLPNDLYQIWQEVSGLRLFEDVNYEQWGFVLWSPEQTVRFHPQRTATLQRELVNGDLAVGEFLGDADLLIVRCDSQADDFGAVLIALPSEPRSSWPVIAATLTDYLSHAVAVATPKYWS